MQTIIVSDVHLGSKHSLAKQFAAFVRGLPPGVELVLNGDTVHHSKTGRLPPEHLEVLELLKKESFGRRITWVRGNHDERFVPEDAGKIEFVSEYSIGKRLFVAHGDDFDNVMPRHRVFVVLFRAFHSIRMFLGAESVHVAYYAKRFAFLYNVLKRHVAENAVEHAKENGYEAVVCGHIHSVEDVTIDGVRYINTGSWTERPMHYVLVTDDAITLVQVGES